MKNLLKIILFILISLIIGCDFAVKNGINKKEIQDFKEILDSFKVDGSILIYDKSNNIYYSNNFDLHGNLPASTFKIPNSIIALELGIIESDTTIIKWNGEKREMEIWEKDLTLKEAFRYSCVPCYQDIARNIGYSRMKDYLKKFNYNEMFFDSLTIDNFWLEGNSIITQKQQIEFLEQFYYEKLPISEQTVKIVKNIMELEKTKEYTLSGKTGLSDKDGIINGWFVGYIESNTEVYFFATNISPKQDLSFDDFISARINVTKDALKYLKIMK